MNIQRWIALVMAALLAVPAYAQMKPSGEQPDETMTMLREQLKKDKKVVVATNMQLTQAEQNEFWPLYEEYQKELHRINDRIAMLIVTYAKEHNAGTLTDAKALKLVEEAIAVDAAEAKLRQAFLPRVAKVLPGLKAARYMQIENKIRALVKYELAAEVPLVK